MKKAGRERKVEVRKIRKTGRLVHAGLQWLERKKKITSLRR